MGDDDAVVERILKGADLYQVLGVDKTCTAEDVKRAYRKLALKVHPDRSRHPKATEAFQRLSHAYQILSDDEKRAHYNQFGDRPPQPPPPHYQQFQRPGNHAYYGFEDEMAADALFQMFFGPRFRYANVDHHRRQQQQQAQAQQMNWQVFLPLLLLAVMLIGQQFFGSRIDWASVITFNEDLDTRRFQLFTSPRMQKQYGVAKSWLRDMGRANMISRDFYDEMAKQADRIYIRHLQAQCRNERIRGMRARPACRELEEHHVPRE